MHRRKTSESYTACRIQQREKYKQNHREPPDRTDSQKHNTAKEKALR